MSCEDIRFYVRIKVNRSSRLLTRVFLLLLNSRGLGVSIRCARCTTSISLSDHSSPPTFFYLSNNLRTGSELEDKRNSDSSFEMVCSHLYKWKECPRILRAASYILLPRLFALCVSLGSSDQKLKSFPVQRCWGAMAASFELKLHRD